MITRTCCLLLLILSALAAAGEAAAHRSAWGGPLRATFKAAPQSWYDSFPAPRLASFIREHGAPDFHWAELLPAIRVLEERHRHTPESFARVLEQKDREALLAEAVAEARNEAYRRAGGYIARMKKGSLGIRDYPEVDAFTREAHRYLDAREDRLFMEFVVRPLSRRVMESSVLSSEALKSANEAAASLRAWETKASGDGVEDEPVVSDSRYSLENPLSHDPIADKVIEGAAMKEFLALAPRGDARELERAATRVYGDFLDRAASSHAGQEIRLGHAGPWARAAAERLFDEFDKVEALLEKGWRSSWHSGYGVPWEALGRSARAGLQELLDMARGREKSHLVKLVEPERSLYERRFIKGALDYYHARLDDARDPHAWLEARRDILQGTVAGAPGIFALPVKDAHQLWSVGANRLEKREQRFLLAMCASILLAVAGLFPFAFMSEAGVGAPAVRILAVLVPAAAALLFYILAYVSDAKPLSKRMQGLVERLKRGAS